MLYDKFMLIIAQNNFCFDEIKCVFDEVKCVFDEVKC
jgi:hypothetical protein